MAKPVLLVPPRRKEVVTGFLWWKKRFVVLASRVLAEDQLKGAMIALLKAIKAEYSRAKGLALLKVEVVGDLNTTFHGHEILFTALYESNDLKAWLTESTKTDFQFNFMLEDGRILHSFVYAEVDGKRACSHIHAADEASMMTADDDDGLRELLKEVEGVRPRS